MVAKKVSSKEFIKELEGCIIEGAPLIDPLSLKKMWEPKIEMQRKHEKK